jgi:hypothetical protein
MRRVIPELTIQEVEQKAKAILRQEKHQSRLVQMKKETALFTPLKDFVKKLEQIRDDALDNGKYAPALQAHMVIGKLAGYFDRVEADRTSITDASTLSNEQLLDKIQKLALKPPVIIDATDVN